MAKFIKLDKTEKNPEKPEKIKKNSKSPKNRQSSPNKSRSKSPVEKKPYLKKNSSAKKTEAKTSVGKNAKKFESSLSSIPEERKKLRLSKKNPLDSVTSLNQSFEELDDIISDLNPSKIPTKKPLSKAKKEEARKAEMDSTDGLFNFRPGKVFEKKEVFGSIEAPLLSLEKPLMGSVFQSISDLEEKRYPKKTPTTRSEFIKSGIKQFSPYMDKDGNVFDPQERFPNIKPDDVDPLDPYFLEEIGNMSPNPSTDWYIRSHHLRSFTNHPLSVNDNPNSYKAQIKFDVQENVNNKPVDQRDEAIYHLEKTLEDLKNELNTRKRIAAVNNFSNENRYAGHLIKAVSPVMQGMNTSEKEGLVLHTYESILEELRAREKEILNQKRNEAYEVNRPPQGKWFELKSSEFTKEIQRHLSSLKPKQEQRKLLNSLAIPDLY